MPILLLLDKKSSQTQSQISETLVLTREPTYTHIQTKQISKEMWGTEIQITNADQSAIFSDHSRDNSELPKIRGQDANLTTMQI